METRRASIVVPRRLDSPNPALINMAHIRVEGLGGLGLVAAVIAVAIADGRIRTAVLIAAVLGAGLAALLIMRRRRDGALPSATGGPDDRSVLHLDGGRSRTSAPTSAGQGPRDRAAYFACVN